MHMQVYCDMLTSCWISGPNHNYVAGHDQLFSMNHRVCLWKLTLVASCCICERGVEADDAVQTVEQGAQRVMCRISILPQWYCGESATNQRGSSFSAKYLTSTCRRGVEADNAAQAVEQGAQRVVARRVLRRRLRRRQDLAHHVVLGVADGRLSRERRLRHQKGSHPERRRRLDGESPPQIRDEATS